MKLTKRNCAIPNYSIYKLEQGGVVYTKLVYEKLQRWLICIRLLEIRKAIRAKLAESN